MMNPESRDSPFHHSSKKPQSRDPVVPKMKPYIPPMGYNPKDNSIEINNKPQTLVSKICDCLINSGQRDKQEPILQEDQEY